MKTALILIAIALLGWAVQGAFSASAARQRAESADSLLAEFRDSVDVERAIRDRDRLERERADSLAALERDRLAMTLRGMRDSLSSLSRASDEAFLAAPDTLKPLLEIFRDETRACRSALELADSLHTLCSEKQARDSLTIRDLRLTAVEDSTTIHGLDASVARQKAIVASYQWNPFRLKLPSPTEAVVAVGLWELVKALIGLLTGR